MSSVYPTRLETSPVYGHLIEDGIVTSNGRQPGLGFASSRTIIAAGERPPVGFWSDVVPAGPILGGRGGSRK